MVKNMEWNEWMCPELCINHDRPLRKLGYRRFSLSFYLFCVYYYTSTFRKTGKWTLTNPVSVTHVLSRRFQRTWEEEFFNLKGPGMTTQAPVKTWEQTEEITVLFWTHCSAKLAARAQYRSQCDQSAATERNSLRKSCLGFFTVNSALCTERAKKKKKKKYIYVALNLAETISGLFLRGKSNAYKHPNLTQAVKRGEESMKVWHHFAAWSLDISHRWSTNEVQVVVGNSTEL